MSLFDEPLPTSYEYNGVEYEMHTDFREWIRFELLMTDPDIIPRDKPLLLARLIFPVVPPDPNLSEFIIWFYSCGRKPPKVKSRKAVSPKKSAAVYSFEYDDGYIYAAFFEQYGIDLTTVEYLHWWKFRALFKGLHDVKICSIMSYRSEEITSKTPESRKKQITELKQIYALPKSLSEQQKIEEARRLMEQYRQ